MKILGPMLLASGFLTACAPGTKSIAPSSGGGVTYEAPTPTVTAITSDSPTPAIGDTIHVFGTNFIDPKHGSLHLGFDGSFKDDGGHTTRDPRAPLDLTYVGDGEATFVLGPDNVFGPPGTIGQFTGNFRVSNHVLVEAVNAQTGDDEVSASLAQTVTIGPSIFVDQLRSVDPAAGCQGLTPSTTGSQNLALAFHYIGMPDASPGDPVFYTVTYDASQLTVAYAANQQYGTWPFWGPTTPNAMGAQVAPSGIASFSVTAMQSNGTTFDPQALQQAVTATPAVTFNQQPQSLVKLAGLATHPVAVGATAPLLLTITAQHQSGAKITRIVDWRVKAAIAMTQPTPTVTVAWGQPTQNEHNPVVCGITANGATTITYQESSSDTQMRSIGWNANVTNSQNINATLGTKLGIFGTGVDLSGTIGQTWSQTFDTNVQSSDSVTMEQSSSTTTPVLPGECVAFFLQWGEQHASVEVTLNDACGGSQDVGTATLISHLPYIAIVQSAQNPPPCPTGNGPNQCHPAGPASN